MYANGGVTAVQRRTAGFGGAFVLVALFGFGCGGGGSSPPVEAGQPVPDAQMSNDATSNDAASNTGGHPGTTDASAADKVSGQEPDATPPMPDATAPMPDAIAPMPDATAPMPDATAPMPDAIAPMPDATAPTPDSSGPMPDAIAPMPDATAPMPDSSGPMITMDAGIAPMPDAHPPHPDATIDLAPDTTPPHPDASIDLAPPPPPVDANHEHPTSDSGGTTPDGSGDGGVVTLPPGVVTGQVHGFLSGRTVKVTLGNDAFLISQPVEADGSYRFVDVPPGKYFLKVEGPSGQATGMARSILVGGGGSFHGLLHTVNDSTISASAGPIDFQLTALPTDAFRYHWEVDVSRSGYEESAHINQPPSIQFLDQPVVTPDLAATEMLVGQFNVVLSDEGVAWTQEYAFRLLETMKAIPQPIRKNAGDATLTPSKWSLTDRHIDGDITVTYGASGNTVTISKDAFVYATPRLVVLDGQRGTFFSKRLHHALVAYVTQNGQNWAAAEKILSERFGCSTTIPDYTALTAPTTAEGSGSFQAFHPAELVQLINLFEEMPDGYHKVPGLKYLVRRKDGIPNPRYPAAAAVAWAWPQSFPNGSYIEFMDATFAGDPDEAHRLILHEKTHFLWAYVFSATLRNDWITLGGWFPNSADPDGWSTTKTTEFVTAYAHKKNPDEDMAESVAFFIRNPAALMSRSMGKYEFIRDRIMQGSRYIAQVQKDLTFEVLDLYPDYDYPGKINRVDISAQGAPDADKTVTIEIGLHTAPKVFAGASRAYLRLFSAINTYQDVYLMPTDASGAVLRGQMTISKFAKSGFWMTDQIIVTDTVGNQRLEGVKDYGWKLYIDNANEDVTPPKYVPGSLTVSRTDDVVMTNDGASHPVQHVEVRWKYQEDHQMQQAYARLTNPMGVDTYPLEAYGTFDDSTSMARVSFRLNEYMASGDYGVPFIMMMDLANNVSRQAFSSAPSDQALVSVPVVSTNHDAQPPQVSLNDDAGLGLHKIQISARPTIPDHPNGETVVTIKYQARDDKSGLGVVFYRLIDPQGISHPQYHYHANFYTEFYEGDPTAWTEYEINVVLPVGSPPGTWGLQDLLVRDKAQNQHDYNFVELIRFDVAT